MPITSSAFATTERSKVVSGERAAMVSVARAKPTKVGFHIKRATDGSREQATSKARIDADEANKHGV